MNQHATPRVGVDDDAASRADADGDATLRTAAVDLPDGRELAYSVCGPADGSPVVLHHGTPGSRLFAALLADAAVEAGVRLVTPDRPGYGRSSPPPDDWGWRDWPEDLTAVLRAESIDRAGLCGFSGGGPFAIAAAGSDRATRLALLSTVVPPSEEGLAGLARIPYAIRLLFPLFGAFASVSGPDTVVSQYTDRSVSEAVARAVAADFHEALGGGGGALSGGGATAVERESRSFANEAVDLDRPDLPVRAWHGTRDDNAPLAPVGEFVDERDGALTTADADHLGTLLDRGSDALRWVAAE
ncbi:Pimeloyl-ACP methyl ester carboxylesterase [Halorubrum aquaticum]|uniref:Pimeloyl-ACP methyl ester carboxylesterase n=1 Tax=Halorubrum aquaticum TaxID=387340 RepID=A0A1I3CLB2_9EURY|nr:alpha/beta hydrolase [Halorubrum aquaticum]SFH75208.1 Pimeloyl-ACP methyl ester carboxylesterase [Halorubrum aquaticum]